MDKGKKPAGIKDVARALGISIATVDRAFHDRPGVNPKTRARVLAMAQKLNYRPNLAARNLKLNRRLTIGVYLPEQIHSFFTPMLEGVGAAADSGSHARIELQY